MKVFCVQGVARIGAGEVIGLTEEQIAPRRHNVDIVKRGDKKTRTIVRARTELHFKAGELIALADIPKYLLGALIDPDAPAGQEQLIFRGGQPASAAA